MDNKCYANFMEDMRPLLEALIRCEVKEAAPHTPSGQLKREEIRSFAIAERLFPLGQEAMHKEWPQTHKLLKIAEAVGLPDREKSVFIQYMVRRFPNEPIAYYREWAERFKKSGLDVAPAANLIYQMSDQAGRKILDDIAKSYKFWDHK